MWKELMWAKLKYLGIVGTADEHNSDNIGLKMVQLGCKEKTEA